MKTIPVTIYIILTIIVLIGSSNIVYAQNTTSNNTNQSNLISNFNAQSIYEQKSAVLGNDVKHFVILIPNEAHESTNQPKKQYPLANQPYIPQNITINKGTSISWFNGDVGHKHVINFQTPNPENIGSTNKFSSLEYTTVIFNQTGKYSYFEDNVNNDDKNFVMKGTINVVDSNKQTQINNNNAPRPINTMGILMVPSKDAQSISSTLKGNGISTLDDYTFTDLRGGQKGTGPTQTILVWGTDNDNIDQAISPIIDITKGLPYS